MRVLQLKVDDEYDLEDPTNLMRKARHRLQEKMKLARDWLANPLGDAHGLGMFLFVYITNILLNHLSHIVSLSGHINQYLVT